MKKTLLAVVMASSVLAGVAHAADGEVKFVGNITATACTVDSSSKNQEVSLGTVATTAFTAAGDKAAPKDFQIKLTSCPETVKNIVVTFDGIADSTNKALLALDSGMTATNVAVEISDTSGNVLFMRENSAQYAVASNQVTISLVGRYVSTAAAVGAGTANATTQFTIDYQ
ncbi:fimbrial protein [Kluyvera sp. CHPC 1.251]|uniref:fimbrial protein n=1 Tax=Kluyvera sp. CHPC 1.251 TaxID=2995175 RepID=UPI002FD83F1B